MSAWQQENGTKNMSNLKRNSNEENLRTVEYYRPTAEGVFSKVIYQNKNGRESLTIEANKRTPRMFDYEYNQLFALKSLEDLENLQYCIEQTIKFTREVMEEHGMISDL